MILFNLCGHGHFDLAAYDAYLAGTLEDPEFSEADMEAALARPAGGSGAGLSHRIELRDQVGAVALDLVHAEPELPGHVSARCAANEERQHRALACRQPRCRGRLSSKPHVAPLLVRPVERCARPRPTVPLPRLYSRPPPE